MEQVRNEQTIYSAAVYCRLSKDDEQAGENSVGVLNSIRYRGYVYDSETGLYYLQSRYYDPEVGRFLNADSVDYIGYSDSVISYNVFAYCENNAVNRWDPSGEYNRDAAYKYAKKYTGGKNWTWLRIFNPRYYYYSGDCANFVSQCLYAGGIKMTSEWYNNFSWKKTWSVSYAWSKAENLRLYFLDFHYMRFALYISFTDNTKKYIEGSHERVSLLCEDAKVGDLLFFDFKMDNKDYFGHAAIITKVTSTDIYYSAHTSNRWNQSLSSYIKEEKDVEQICIIAIKDNAV